MTFDDTIHIDDWDTFHDFNNDEHWRNHEEGHIKNGVDKWDLVWYVLISPSAAEDEINTGDRSKHGGLGHDYNQYEQEAEAYAQGQDGNGISDHRFSDDEDEVPPPHWLHDPSYMPLLMSAIRAVCF